MSVLISDGTDLSFFEYADFRFVYSLNLEKEKFIVVTLIYSMRNEDNRTYVVV